jgi:hypothetical protein
MKRFNAALLMMAGIVCMGYGINNIVYCSLVNQRQAELEKPWLAELDFPSVYDHAHGLTASVVHDGDYELARQEIRDNAKWRAERDTECMLYHFCTI